MAHEETFKECVICNEDFDEERCPRMLPCSHCLCTHCINQLIAKNAQQCPFCRKYFDANSSDDIPINYMAVELLRYISEQKSSTKSSERQWSDPLAERITNLKKVFKEKCDHYFDVSQVTEERLQQIIKELFELRRNMKEESHRIESDVLPNIHDLLKRNDETVREMDILGNKLRSEYEEMVMRTQQLENMQSKFSSCTEDTFKETAFVLDKVEDVSRDISSWLANLTKSISEKERTLRVTQKEFKKTEEKISVILEVLNSQIGREEEEEEEGEELDTGIGAMAIPNEALSLSVSHKTTEVVSPQGTTETLRISSDEVKNMLKEGEEVFAVQHQKGKRRWAKISITDDDRLCLHHLKQDSPSSHSRILEHDDVMKLIDTTSRLTFIDLGVGESTLGRLYIRLTPDTKRAQHFSFLCSGERGPSYANTNILYVGYETKIREFVRCGDYEYNDGRGGKALVPGLVNERGGDYIKPWLAGTVEAVGYGDSLAAQFDINIKDFPSEECNPSFGIIEEGLHVLKKAISRYPSIKVVIIQDCGIVLSR